MITSCIITLFVSGLVNSAPAIDIGVISASDATPTNSAAQSTATVPFISLEPNGPLWDSTFQGSPQPIRGSLGATLLGPTDDGIDKENPDLLAPPSTGPRYHVCLHSMFPSEPLIYMFLYSPNAKWPFSLSHNRLQTGGWARQENSKIYCVYNYSADSF
jgi:hypothetical protein